MKFTNATVMFACALLAAPAAQAKVSADDVWAAIQKIGGFYGETITGSPARAGNVLTITDLTVSLEMPEGAFTAKTGVLTLTENGDETVTVRLANPSPLTVVVKSPDFPDEVVVNASLEHAGLDTRVSGTPEAMRFVYDTATASLAATNIDVALPSDTDVALNDFTMNFTANNVMGDFAAEIGETLRLTSIQQFSSASLAMSAQVVAEGETGGGNVVLELGNYASNSDVRLNQPAKSPNMLDLISAGMSAAATSSLGASSVVANVNTPDGDLAVNASLESLSTDVALSEVSGTYSATETGIRVSVSSDQIPFPSVGFAMGEASTTVQLPVQPAETDGDLRMQLALRDLTIDDTIWNLFDPAGQLPRDPATVAIDLSGKGRWFVNIFDPQVAENLQGLPGEISSVSVDTLDVRAAGATLSGLGAFTFDYTDMVSFGGAPRPEGKLSLKASGINGLPDTLVNMGLVQQEQIMGARMMMGLFARPGAGDDTLESELEVTKDGQVLANGQRLR